MRKRKKFTTKEIYMEKIFSIVLSANLCEKSLNNDFWVNCNQMTRFILEIQNCCDFFIPDL